MLGIRAVVEVVVEVTVIDHGQRSLLKLLVGRCPCFVRRFLISL